MVAEDGDLDRILAEVLKLQAEAEKRNPRHPTQEDREIAERLRSHITAGTLGQYEATLPDEERRDVSALAIRGAALALYDDDPSIIELAVCAACMGGLTPGSRESMIDMSCVADASKGSAFRAQPWPSIPAFNNLARKQLRLFGSTWIATTWTRS